MKKAKKEIEERMSEKRHVRNKQIKIDRQTDGSHKALAVTKRTRMRGTEPKVYRGTSSGEGLPKWKKR